MDPSGLVMTAGKLILKIHVITGWEVPTGELMDVLLDQFIKKIIESFPNLNADELEYAFRNKPYRVQEWGKAMNVSIIDEVVSAYLEKRIIVSSLEERSKNNIEHKPSKEQLVKIDEEFDQFLLTDLGKRLFPGGVIKK